MPSLVVIVLMLMLMGCLLCVRLWEVEVTASTPDAVHELLFPLDVGNQTFGWRISVYLHDV